MNKLIKYFNENYSKDYGKISYPRTTIQIYRVYQAIKSYGIKDEELVKLLHNVKLPNPKSIEEKELYADCLYNKDDSEMVIDTSNLISKENPVFTGSISLGREEGTTVGEGSYAVGASVTASGNFSHAEGNHTLASSESSHAEGCQTKASSEYQHVQGRYNIEDTKNRYAHIVGNGNDDDKRSNAHTLDWNGNGWYAGKLSQEGTPTGAKDLTTKKYVDTSLNNKVDKINGKGLSTVDFTTTYETKLKGLENYNDTTIKKDIQTLSTQFKDIAKQIESGNIGNNVEPALMDMPRIYFSEGTLPTTKTATMMRFDYYSKTAEYHGWAEIKCQGNSSMQYNKKNFTIKLYKDKAKTEKLKIDFKGWGKQSKFVLKANWIDITHARNIVSARIWGDIVKSRSDYSNLPELLRTSPNQGAIDGFPITVYGNGYYQGRYTLNIPKDKWMSNMDDSLDIHCILCGENYYSGCFLQSANIDGSDWTDELHDVVPTSIKTRWNEVITFVKDSTDVDFKANLNNYIDVESAIDYLLYGIISTGLDAFGKNQIYMTYDGIKWIASMYDMDSTWGLWWNGNQFVATDYAREQFQDMTKTSDCSGEGNKLYVRLQNLFINEIKARYTELRQTIFTYPYLVNKFEEFTQICPQDVVKEDYASTTANNAYIGIPSKTTNNIQQLRNYINARLTYVDSYINSLIEPIPCTAITLDKSTLSFTTSSAQTLTATVTPTNTTDTVEWSVSPTGICTVENGVVTPVTNGNCVITAKCGEQTATCNVTVSGITTQYTITNNLTNCVTSNITTTAEENSSYSTTITANNGYTLDNVTVTMGGTDITNTSVSNGVITINSVTGNIVITANANIQISTPIYTLAQATTFDGIDDYIDTGIKLFDTAKDFTIYIDFTPTAGATQVYQATTFHCENEVSPYRGLSLMDNMICGQDFTTSSYYASGIASGKLVIVFKNGVISSIRNNSMLKTKISSSNDKYVQVNKNLTLGACQLDNGTMTRFWNGTIKECKVWFEALTLNQINEILGMSTVTPINGNYLANATWENGSILPDSTSLNINGSETDKYTTVMIPQGKYKISSIDAAWKKCKVLDYDSNIIYKYGGSDDTNDLSFDTGNTYTSYILQVSYYKPNDKIIAPSLTKIEFL